MAQLGAAGSGEGTLPFSITAGGSGLAEQFMEFGIHGAEFVAL